MMRFAKYTAFALIAVVTAALLYGAKGYVDARRASADLAARADRLIADNRGAASLGAGRIDQLIQVQDPNFWRHRGVDMTTPGAGATTMTQSLSKRLAFDAFRPGIGKIRQTGYALGLEQRLTKWQIIALFLATVEMGRGPNGWITGFHAASDEVFDRPVADLGERQFLTLVAVMIAPARFDLQAQDHADLAERIRRIERLIARQYLPLGNGDTLLEGCA